MLGGEYSIQFFKDSWYIFLIFLLTIGLIDGYFFLNWKLFSLLEAENWDDIIIYLENKIFLKKHVYVHLLKILANTYLIKTNIDGISKLEDFLRQEKPELIKKLIIPLSVPKFIDGDPGSMEDYFKEFILLKRIPQIAWVKFLYAFSLLLNNKREAASDTLLKLCKIKISPILRLLVIYSLNPFFEIAKNDKFVCVESSRKDLKSKFSREKMNLELERVNNTVLALVLNKFAKQAIEWLYKE